MKISNLFVGGLTGAIEITCTYPTEYTKTVMQLSRDKNSMGAIAVIKDTIKTNGFFGLYKGYSAPLLFSMPKSYIRFGTYTYAQENIFTEKTSLNFFLSGLCSGTAAAIFVVTP